MHTTNNEKCKKSAPNVALNTTMKWNYNNNIKNIFNYYYNKMYHNIIIIMVHTLEYYRSREMTSAI